MEAKWRNIGIALLCVLALWAPDTHATSQTAVSVATIHRPPFVFIEREGEVLRYRGFTIDLLRAIEERTSYTFTFVPHTVFREMLQSVQVGDTPLAAANISATSEREAVMDFTHPIFNGGLHIITRAQQSPSLLSVIYHSGVVQFVLGALAILLIIAHILWFFERNVKDRRHDYFRDDYFGGVWDAFWWAFIIMTMGGFENEVPHKTISRLLAMTWIVVSLFFISTLTAKITTALTVESLSGGISSYEDLYDKRVGVARGTTMERFAQQNGLPFTTYDDFTVSLDALRTGAVDAVIADAPVAQYFVRTEGRTWAQLAGDVFAPDMIAIAVNTHYSALREELNRALLEMREDGTYEALRTRWFGAP